MSCECNFTLYLDNAAYSNIFASSYRSEKYDCSEARDFFMKIDSSPEKQYLTPMFKVRYAVRMGQNTYESSEKERPAKAAEKIDLLMKHPEMLSNQNKNE